MAGLSGGIKFLSAEYRPCIIKGRKALFHRWAVKARVISPGCSFGGHPGGRLWALVGIVEDEDGAVHECYPYEIRFCDDRLKEYAFNEMDT